MSTKPPRKKIMVKAAWYRKQGETKRRALSLAWDDAVNEHFKKHGRIPKWYEWKGRRSRKK